LVFVAFIIVAGERSVVCFFLEDLKLLVRGDMLLGKFYSPPYLKQTA
jgi:hypothetical protein